MASTFHEELVIFVDLRYTEALFDHIIVACISSLALPLAEMLVFNRCLLGALVAARYLKLWRFSAASSHLRKRIKRLVLLFSKRTLKIRGVWPVLLCLIVELIIVW